MAGRPDGHCWNSLNPCHHRGSACLLLQPGREARFALLGSKAYSTTEHGLDCLCPEWTPGKGHLCASLSPIHTHTHQSQTAPRSPSSPWSPKIGFCHLIHWTAALRISLNIKYPIRWQEVWIQILSFLIQLDNMSKHTCTHAHMPTRIHAYTHTVPLFL